MAGARGSGAMISIHGSISRRSRGQGRSSILPDERASSPSRLSLASLDLDEMALRGVVSSKFRHTFGTAAKRELCYEGVKISRNAHDGNFCAVSTRHLAIVTDSSGGGTFVVVPLNQTGRVDSLSPKVAGHAGPVMELKWNPFDDNVIASASDDATVKVWSIPEDGLIGTITQPDVTLAGHGRRVAYIDWHPTASNVLLSASYDHRCIVWNVETGQDVVTVDAYDDTIYSVSWNRDGSLFASTCRDRQVRVIDPRQRNLAQVGSGHASTKSSRAAFTASPHLLLTTGFSKVCERQCALWDIRNLNDPLKMENIDSSSGILIPFYDPDTNIVFLAGKGDGNIRYYEVMETAPYLFFLGNYQSSSPQRSLGMLPKRAVDAWKCEIARFYKLHAVKDVCEPVSFVVPRKSEAFQDSLFPPTASGVPSLTAEEWLAGENRGPILMSLKDKQVASEPSKVKVTPALTQRSTAQNRNHDNSSSSSSSSKTQTRDSSSGQLKTSSSSSNNNSNNSNSSNSSNGLTSFKTVYRLTSSDPTDDAKEPAWNPDTPDVVMSHPVPATWKQGRQTKGGTSPTATLERAFTLPGTSHSPPAADRTSVAPDSNAVALEELRRAYSEKLDVIKSLEERLRLKDRRIQQLEEHVAVLQGGAS